MGIGQAGKRAQALGKAQQQRYRLDYQPADETPLVMPARPESGAEDTPPAETQQTVPPAPRPATIQRSPATSQAASSQTTAPAASGAIVQRVEDAPAPETTEESPAGGDDIKPEDVAEEVYKRLARDLRIERERRGRGHLRS